MSAQQLPEPLAALAAIEAEIKAIRAEETAIETDWIALAMLSAGWNTIADKARALVAREQQLAERRRALNSRLPQPEPQAAPVEPVKAERGAVKHTATCWIRHLDALAAGSETEEKGLTIEAYAARNGVKLKSLKNAIAALREKSGAARMERIEQSLANAPNPLSGCDEEAA